MLGGGRWKSLDWSCCALGQGRVPLTQSTGSSHTAFCPWTWGVRQKCMLNNTWRVKDTDFVFTINVTLMLVFTLMPSLAPSCRYGMMEWFHRSINHCLNSDTDTGHDRKKQGPWEGKDSYYSLQISRYPCFLPYCTHYISPIRKSEVLCFSRNVWRWYQSWGTQSSTQSRAWWRAESCSSGW